MLPLSIPRREISRCFWVVLYVCHAGYLRAVLCHYGPGLGLRLYVRHAGYLHTVLRHYSPGLGLRFGEDGIHGDTDSIHSSGHDKHATPFFAGTLQNELQFTNLYL